MRGATVEVMEVADWVAGEVEVMEVVDWAEAEAEVMEVEAKMVVVATMEAAKEAGAMVVAREDKTGEGEKMAVAKVVLAAAAPLAEGVEKPVKGAALVGLAALVASASTGRQ